MADQTSSTQTAASPATGAAQTRGIRKERLGVVISNKMTKTVVVRVDRRVPHAVYGKVVTRSSKFYAHDEESKAKIGDRVRIVETKPLSRLKRWRVVEVIPASKASLAKVGQE